ncbi:PilN domain-containing protein [Bradyrhizobium sp. AUGA SZCCT0274]|uniref:PilN domain-containing protein n=1 Tax=Bradyrhizobium sp. AUGA SZCCT0274 TaxID=2807670 RepID=UPI001BAACAB4|nr:PilN domain-containing protein [Bradyrhizobium sp. AUGA SZCCT0274]MBR1241925.1 PilN domain-containing protein [Bradyrhizobium sp. AUGA SZCCT0274]
MLLSLSQPSFATLSRSLNRFGAWWLKEFRSLFPDRILQRIAGRGRTLLVVAVDQEDMTLELLTDGFVSTASERTAVRDDALAAIDRFLVSRGLDRLEVDIGLCLAVECAFGRQLLLPAEAGDAIDAIVAQDLAKKTPFKAEDIYSDHVARESAADGKIEIQQWITRRQFVHQALSRLGMSVENLTFIVFNGRGGVQPVPMINLRRQSQARGTWSQWMVPALCCSAIALWLLSGCLRYTNQQAALDRLSTDIAATSSKAAQVRKLFDQLQEKRSALVRLRLQRSEAPGLTDLWEETTRVLPPHSWLTEFRLAETGKRDAQVSLVGYSSAAPSLVGIIDGSRLFFDTALTSPVAFDATEGRERFALQSKVRLPEILKEATR